MLGQKVFVLELLIWNFRGGDQFPESSKSQVCFQMLLMIVAQGISPYNELSIFPLAGPQRGSLVRSCLSCLCAELSVLRVVVCCLLL